MGIEQRRAAAAMRNAMGKAGRRVGIGGAGARPLGAGMGDIDTLALMTEGELTEAGGIDVLSIEAGGDVTA